MIRATKHIHIPAELLSPDSVGMPELSEILSSIYAIEEVRERSERLLWMRQFYKAYTDGLRPMGPWIYKPEYRFFSISVGRKKAGFIAIRVVEGELFTDRLGMQDVWEAEMAYIKPKYRSKGLLRRLLAHVIDYERVGMVSIECWRYLANKDYYVSLGFDAPMYFGTSLLSVMHKDLHEETLRRCPDMGGAKKIAVAA